MPIPHILGGSGPAELSANPRRRPNVPSLVQIALFVPHPGLLTNALDCFSSAQFSYQETRKAAS